jgi:hypothetical protein
VSQPAHPAAVGGAETATTEDAAALEACTGASLDGCEPSDADSDSDEAALPPQAPLSGVSQLSSSNSGGVGCVGGCGCGSGSGVKGHMTAGRSCSAGSAAVQSALQTYEYHVVHSAAYGVPLLFLRGCHAGN